MFSKGDNSPKRSNPIGEDNDLKQKKQIKVEQISRLMLKLVDYRQDIEMKVLYRSRLIGFISRLMEEINRLVCMISRLIKRFLKREQFFQVHASFFS